MCLEGCVVGALLPGMHACARVCVFVREGIQAYSCAIICRFSFRGVRIETVSAELRGRFADIPYTPIKSLHSFFYLGMAHFVKDYFTICQRANRCKFKSESFVIVHCAVQLCGLFSRVIVTRSDRGLDPCG